MQQLDENKIEKLRTAFNAHPFFLYAKSVHTRLSDLCGNELYYMLYDAQLFYDASLLLDQLISEDGVRDTLWSDLLAQYRKFIMPQSGNPNQEIAMLLYIVGYIISGVYGLKGTIRKSMTLLKLTKDHLDKGVADQFSKAMCRATEEQDRRLHDWLADYTSGETLTQQIEEALKPRKAKPKIKHGFHINASDEAIDDIIKDVFDVMKNNELIPLDVPLNDIKKTFSGRPCNPRIRWMKSLNLLAFFIKKIRRLGIRNGTIVIIPQDKDKEWGEDKRLVAIPDDANIWCDVVCQCFVDKDDSPISHDTLSGATKEPKRGDNPTILDDLVEAFKQNYQPKIMKA